jgi:hypothetical protein
MLAGILLHLARGGQGAEPTHGRDRRGFPVAWGRRQHARAANHAFPGAKITLRLIDGHWLGGLLRQAAILGAWVVR